MKKGEAMKNTEKWENIKKKGKRKEKKGETEKNMGKKEKKAWHCDHGDSQRCHQEAWTGVLS